jgi:hypothetical protein
MWLEEATVMRASEAKRMRDELNVLLRSELQAAAGYRAAEERYGAHVAGPTLQRLATEHLDTAEDLAAAVRVAGGEPTTLPSGDGELGVASIEALDDETALLAALRSHEEAGLRACERLLERETLPELERDLLLATVLPRRREHLAAIAGCVRSVH